MTLLNPLARLDSFFLFFLAVFPLFTLTIFNYLLTLLWYGNSSVLWTTTKPLRLRFLLAVSHSRIWRRLALPRMMVPFLLTLNLFAAALFVFNFGIYFYLPCLFGANIKYRFLPSIFAGFPQFRVPWSHWNTWSDITADILMGHFPASKGHGDLYLISLG